jgi:TolB-like protein/class 3 adenylate cyclase
MSEGTQRKLAAIVSADVVGYSRLMGADEGGTLAAMQAHRGEFWDPVTKQFGGRIVGTAGDGQLIEFASAVAAVECSVAIQRGMLERNAELPQDRWMLLRVGINMGEVIVAGDDLYGDGVNIAARLQELAEPGGIAIADIVHGQVHDKLDVTFTDDGEHKAKNIARPIRVWRWSPAGLIEISVVETSGRSEALALPDKPSIAVLPFDNMSGDPEQEYFSDGISEDLTTALSRFDGLFVIARNSAFTYKGEAVDVKRVGRELGVHYVLEGSVRRAGERVRVNAQLIDAAADLHVWAERFDRQIDDIFELQDDIVASIAAIVGPEITTAEIERARGKRPDTLDVWDYYLRALAAFHKMTSETSQPHVNKHRTE